MLSECKLLNNRMTFPFRDRVLTMSSRMSYRTDQPFVRLLNDAMVLPLFDGGNIGVRRRQLEKTFQHESYDSLAAWY